MEEETSGEMRCTQCRRPFATEDRIASMSGSIMGDEHTDSYLLCPVCAVYTVVSWRDDFTGVETVECSGPIDKQQGDVQVGIIRQCSRPWDKKCRCDAHVRYFRGTLD